MQAEAFQHRFHVDVEGEAAANHGAVFFRVDRGQPQIGEDLARGHVVGDAPHQRRILARGGGVIQQAVGEILAEHLGQQGIVAQVFDQLAAVSQLIRAAAGVHHDDLIEAFERFGVAHQRGEGRKPGAGGEEPQPLAGQQRVQHQRAHGFGAQDDLVAFLDVLQLRGQRAVRHLDRIKLQLVIPVGRGDGIGAQDRFAVIAGQADHHEFARTETQAGRTRHPEGKQPVGPMFHRRHRLRIGQGRFVAVGLGLIFSHGEIQCHQNSCNALGQCGASVKPVRGDNLSRGADSSIRFRTISAFAAGVRNG